MSADIATHTMSTNIDWHKWCRLCAKCDPLGNVSVFQTNEHKRFDATMAAAIGKYFWVNIKIDDTLSRDLCKNCHILMTELIKFAERVNKVQAMYCVLQNIGTNTTVNPNDVRRQYLEDDWEHIIKSDNIVNENKKRNTEYKVEVTQGLDQKHVDVEDDVEVEQIVEYDTIEYEEEELPVKEQEVQDTESIIKSIEYDRDVQKVLQTSESSKANEDVKQNKESQVLLTKSPEKQRFVIKSTKDLCVQSSNGSELDSDEKELEFEFMSEMDHEEEVDENNMNMHGSYKCDVCFKVYKNPACFRKHILQGHSKNETKPLLVTDAEPTKSHEEFEVEFVSDVEDFDDDEANTDLDVDEHNSNSECKDDRERVQNDGSSELPVEEETKSTRKRRHRKNSITDHFIKVSRRNGDDSSSSSRGPRYQCEICNKPYKSPTCYRKHMIDAHNKEANIIELPCDKCEQTFFTEKQLASHRRRHLPASEKLDYECTYCEKRFTTIGALRQHVSGIHFDEKPFICDECGKPLRTFAALNEHKLVHTDDTPVECEVCGKRFKNKARMKVHMDTHASTEYTCNICGLALNTRRTLKMHMLVHTDEKQYKCTFCPAAFKRTKALKNHLILHTGLRPYVCNFCKKTFSNGSNCRAHKKKVHPVELAKEEKEGRPAERTNIPNLNELRSSSKITNPRKVTRNGGLSQRMRALIIAAEQREMLQNLNNSNNESDTMDTMHSFVVEEEDLSNLISDSQNDEDEGGETIIYEVIDTI